MVSSNRGLTEEEKQRFADEIMAGLAQASREAHPAVQKLIGKSMDEELERIRTEGAASKPQGPDTGVVLGEGGLTEEEKQRFADGFIAGLAQASRDAQPAIRLRAQELGEEGMGILRTQDPVQTGQRLRKALDDIHLDQTNGASTSLCKRNTDEPAGPYRPQTDLKKNAHAPVGRGAQAGKGSLLAVWVSKFRCRLQALVR